MTFPSQQKALGHFGCISNEGLFEVLTLEFKAGVLQAISILDDLQQSSRFEFTAIICCKGNGVKCPY